MTGERSNWYIAEVVLLYREQPASTDLVHVNSILISAKSDAEAYEKSLSYGKSQTREYRNTDGKMVAISFVGLRNLVYVYDGLNDGAELMYEEIADLRPDQIQSLAKPKEHLSVFVLSGAASMEQ